MNTAGNHSGSFLPPNQISVGVYPPFPYSDSKTRDIIDLYSEKVYNIFSFLNQKGVINVAKVQI